MESCIGQNRVYVFLAVLLNMIFVAQGQLQAFCEQPAERGPCNNLELRYRFSEETEYCATFLYGGCEGNENNFKTLEECVEACVDEPVPDCELPKDSGTCFQANQIRYYFSESAERCEKFYFSGCQGNENNFETEEECREECGGKPPEKAEETKTENKEQNLWSNTVRISSQHSASDTKGNGFTLVDNDPGKGKTKSTSFGTSGGQTSWTGGAKSTSGGDNLSGSFNRSWQSSNTISTTAQSSTWGQNLRQQWNSSGGTKNNESPTSANKTSETGWKPNAQMNTKSSGANSWSNQPNWNNRNRWHNMAGSNKQNWKGGNSWNQNWNNKSSWNNKWNPQGNAKVKNRWNTGGSNSQSSNNNNQNVKGNNNLTNGGSNQNNNRNWNQNGNVLTNNNKNTWQGNQKNQWNTKRWHSNGVNRNKNTNTPNAGVKNKSNNFGKGIHSGNPSNQGNNNVSPGTNSWHSNKGPNTASWSKTNNAETPKQNWNNGKVGWKGGQGTGWKNQNLGGSNNKAGGSGPTQRKSRTSTWQSNKAPNQLRSWSRKRKQRPTQNKNTLSEQNQNTAASSNYKSGNPPVSFVGNLGMQSTAIHQNTKQPQSGSFNLNSAPVINEMVNGISKMSQLPSGNSNAFSRRNNNKMAQNQPVPQQNNWNRQNGNSESGGLPKRWHSMRSQGNSWNVNTNQNTNQNENNKFGQSFPGSPSHNGNNGNNQVNQNNAHGSWNNNNHGPLGRKQQNNVGHINNVNSYQVVPTQPSNWHGNQQRNGNPSQQQGNGNNQWNNQRPNSPGFLQHNNNQKQGPSQHNIKSWSSIKNNLNSNTTVFSGNQNHPSSPNSFSMMKHPQGSQSWQRHPRVHQQQQQQQHQQQQQQQQHQQQQQWQQNPQQQQKPQQQYQMQQQQQQQWQQQHQQHNQQWQHQQQHQQLHQQQNHQQQYQQQNQQQYQHQQQQQQHLQKQKAIPFQTNNGLQMNSQSPHNLQHNVAPKPDVTRDKSWSSKKSSDTRSNVHNKKLTEKTSFGGPNNIKPQSGRRNSGRNPTDTIKTWTDPKKVVSDMIPTPTVLSQWQSPGEIQQNINVQQMRNSSGVNEYTFHTFSNVKEVQNSNQFRRLDKLDRFHPDVITSKMDVRKTRIGPPDKVQQTVDSHGSFVLPMSKTEAGPSEEAPTSETIIHAVDLCLQSKNVGRCKGYEPSYYHNQETKQCELFIYSGCGGNSNLFYTRSDCEKTCHVEPLPVCDQPVDTGTCAGHRIKYYYNKTTHTCEQFTYTGCEGNDNRFDTIEQCQATCTYESLCQLPKDLGPCKYWEPRYWYNPANKECEVFYYGGCDGNKNNFRDIDTCRKHCVNNVR